MTCNTSAVAVCCSKASRVSVNSRAFSIAMTACSAKFCKQRDLLVGERPHLLAIGRNCPEHAAVRPKRDCHRGVGLTQLEKCMERSVAALVSVVRGNVEEVDNA